jgi:hypothetical protein
MNTFRITVELDTDDKKSISDFRKATEGQGIEWDDFLDTLDHTPRASVVEVVETA